MTNKPRGVLYIGVTAYLAARIDQHRRDVGSAFCRKYGLKTLVLAEPHDTIDDAIRREKIAQVMAKTLENSFDRRSQPRLARPVRKSGIAA